MEYLYITGDSLPECAALYAEVFSAPPRSESWTPEHAQLRLKEILETPGCMGIAAMDHRRMDGLVMGIVQTRQETREYRLEEMCVAHDKQRYGVGTGLMQALLEALSDRHVGPVYLITQRESGAADFYSHLGFKTSRRMADMTFTRETSE